MRRISPLLLFLVLLAKMSVSAQQSGTACSMPSFSAVVNEPNIFSEQQEEWLGEIIDPQIERDFNIIADPETDYLNRLGQRLLAQLPPTQVHYRFIIIDFPGNDAFGIVGGYIYLSRKIIALAQNEDELAGLLGHEIGHIITHQTGIDLSREFRWVLNVTQLGDRQDILEKWNRLLDSAAKNPEKYSEKRSQQEQMIADRIALYSMMRAGYQPSRFVDFFGRMIASDRNKGSFWSRFFGRSTPDVKRLQEMARNAGPLPPECITPLATASNQQFLKWQKEVIESKFVATREALPGLVTKTALNPRLRSTLNLLQFSPDGKYLLAQDESSIYVFTSNPVTGVFVAEAPDTYDAQFTPDSRAVVFYDKELRVQNWSIETGKRNAMYQVAVAAHCFQTALSHSGEVLACLTRDYDVQLIDVKSSSVIFKGGKLRKPSQWENFMNSVLSSLEDVGLFEFGMHFSPDDHYFLAGHEDSAVAYDLQGHVQIELRRNIKAIAGSPFTFLPNGDIVGYDWDFQHRISELRFPSGEQVQSFFTALTGELMAPARGDYLIVLQGNPPVTLLDMKTKRVLLTRKTPAFAIHDQLFAGENANGEIAVFTLPGGKYASGIDLPDGPLDGARTAVFSSDGKWLAVSGKTRGAIWKVDNGERTRLTPAFDGALFDPDALIARSTGSGGSSSPVLKIEFSGKEGQNLYYLPENPGREATFRQIMTEPRFTQLGELVVRTSFEWDKKGGYSMVQVFNVHDNAKLWERKVAKAMPGVFYSRPGKTLTLLIADYDSIKAEAANDPKVKAGLDRLASEEAKKDSYVLKVFDAKTGRDLGVVVVDSGNLSFTVRAAYAVRDTLLVQDSLNRTQAYSLQSGEQKGRVFGHPRAVSAAGDKILVENGKGTASLYEIPGFQPLTQFSFPSRIIHAEFLEDDTIIVLTADQTVYTLKNPGKQQTAGVN